MPQKQEYGYSQSINSSKIAPEKWQVQIISLLPIFFFSRAHILFREFGKVLLIGYLNAQIIEIDTLMNPSTKEWALPSGWLLPGSVEFIPPLPYEYDTLSHILRWEPLQREIRIRLRLYRLPSADSIYRPLPWQALQRWDSLTQLRYSHLAPTFSMPPDTFSPRLTRQGSLVRSLTVGTGQSATLNGAFRLNLEGLIAPDLYLLAALTDENLPFQTATTQGLSDFDRVNIGLRWKKSQLLLGDLELRENSSYFANFYRNVLGIEAKVPLGRHALRTAFSEAKGIFHTNSFMGQEGRQGPYSLTGKNGERFISILAGSEKVYVNGTLMRRGQDQDYVMDYALGEITFMPRVPITAATRIVVDFEYVDRSYGRSFFWIGDSWQGERTRLSASYIRQADNPRRPLDFSLSPEEEALLAALPPGQRVGLLPGVDTLPYERGAIRYAARDTLIGADSVRFFVVSQDPEEALYQVNFTYVGPGKGDYIRETSSLNGNAFRWVGAGKGDYIIGRAVPLPTSVEVLSTRYTWHIFHGLNVEGEIDGSRYIPNRFSGRSLHDIAMRHTIRYKVRPDSAYWQIQPEITLQYVGANYQNIDRVYEREYGRLWNYNDLGQRATEKLVEGRTILNWKNKYRTTPQTGLRRWGDSLRTARISLLWEGLDTLKGLGGNYLIEYIPSFSGRGSDRWLRQTGKVFYTYRRWQAGSAIWGERRSSTLLDTANFHFHEYTPYLRYQWNKGLLRLSYQWRKEWQVPFQDATREKRLRFTAYMPQVEFSHQGEKIGFSTTTAYRIFQPGDAIFQLNATRTLLTQNNFRLRFSPWELESFYQLSAEQTPQRQVLFVAVNPGQGTHEWRDINGDGLQQIEEFIPTINPLLANYIRIQRATGKFLPAIALSLAFSGRWHPTKRLRWLSYQTNSRLEQRQNASDTKWFRYLPTLPAADTSFLQWNFLHRQDIFLFRSSTRGDQTFSFQYQLSQLVPLSGIQRQKSSQYSSRSRYNISAEWGLELLLAYLQKNTHAPLQAELNYAYDGIDLQPQVVYQPNTRWRTSLSIAYKHRNVIVPSRIRARGIRLPLEERVTWKAGAFIGLRIEPAFFYVSENLLPLLSFDLLEGMQPGRNVFISFTLNFPINRFVELSLLYEGRYSRQAPTHSARMQAKANF
ncbi:MAG: hypothetical protein NZ933_06340 [Bacteroidia bacterium]|nr:hypothetical protein [Bacteroidia bacterium]